MFKIIKFARKSWYIMIGIVGLLLIQVSCDLALPQYTTNIVDIGIQNGGIDSIIPELIRESQLENWVSIIENMDQDIDIRNNYQLLSNNQLKDIHNTYSFIEPAISSEENIYQLKSDVDKQELEGLLLQNYDPTEVPMITMQMITYIQKEYKEIGIDLENMQTSYILKNGGVMLAIAFGGVLIAILAGYLTARLAAKTSLDLRSQLFKKVITFSNGEMDQFSTASLITRTTNDIQQIQTVTLMIFRMVVFAPLMGIGGIIKVFDSNHGSMFWIIGLAVTLVAILVAILMIVAMPKFKKMQDLLDRVNLVAREILIGIPVVRAFSREKHEEKRFEKANKDLMNLQLFTNRAMAIMQPFMILIMNSIGILILWVGAQAIDAGTLQVGEMMEFITYAMQIVFSFLMITIVSIMLPRAAVAATRVDEVLKSETLIHDKDTLAQLPSEGRGELKFNHVHFQYPNAEGEALTDIHFSAHSGETTAIIGSTGCGKSTLLHLIPRLFDVTKGSITIDGEDIRNVAQSKLREIIGFVPQKGVLFSGSIEKNLKFGKEDATMEEVEKALEIAQATGFVREDPEGLQRYIAQGGDNVSGGQKQRLAIARAMVKQPKIYIFDDSFSALDYKTDIALRKALQNTTKNDTVLIVAQRISTIAQADKIIVLEEGHIVGIGKHHDLLAENEVYRQIAMSQLSEEEIEKNLKEGGK